MPPVGFEPTISTGERPQTYALDRAATETVQYIIYIYIYIYIYIKQDYTRVRPSAAVWFILSVLWDVV